MAIQFVITIDTEEDQWDTYSAEVNTVENIDRLLFIQKLFDKYDAVPTYLVNWPVITTYNSLEIIQNLYNEHNCEIGTHCHPWNTPPFDEEINEVNSMMCNLPYDIIERKMTRLHDAIAEGLNKQPRCFRAGRWGFNGNVARCLQKLGYKIDSSVTPLVDWSIYSGPNFTRAPVFPYYFDADNIFKQSPDGALFELPASVSFLQRNFTLCNRVQNFILSTGLYRLRLLGIFDKMKLLNQRWLSPEVSSAEDMIKLVDVMVKNGHRILNFTFHSTSLLPGKSPYVQSEEELDKFINKIESVLTYCKKRNFKFVALSEIVKDLQ